MKFNNLKDKISSDLYELYFNLFFGKSDKEKMSSMERTQD